MYKNFDVTVDTVKGYRNQTFVVNTNDLQTLKFSIAITQSSAPIDLTGATVRVAIKKPDKTSVFQDCVITDAADGKCEVVLLTQAYVVPGLHVVEVMVYYDAETVAVTGRFSYTASKGILDDESIQSTNEFQSITQTLSESTQMLNDVNATVEDLRLNGTGIDAQARSDIDTLASDLASMPTQRRKDIVANKRPPRVTRFVEGREIIAYCDATIKTQSRLTATVISKNELSIEKTDSLNPAVVEWYPTYEKNPFNPKTIDFIITSADISQITEIEFRIYPGDGGYYTRFLGTQIPKNLPANTPILLRVPIVALTNSGATTPVKILSTGYIQLRITGNLGAKFKIKKGFYGTYPKTPTMIQFDDGNISVYEKAFPLMKERGIVGTFNIITERVGVAGTVSWPQLHEMQDAGWSICNHTHTHMDLMTGTIQEAVQNAETSQRILAENGFTGSRYLAPPFNSLDSTRLNYFQHIMLGRKTGASYGGYLQPSTGYVTMPGKSVPYNETVTNLMNEYRTLVSQGAFFSPTFHIITDGMPDPAYYEFNVNDFESFLDSLMVENAYFINVEQFLDTYLINDSDI